MDKGIAESHLDMFAPATPLMSRGIPPLSTTAPPLTSSTPATGTNAAISAPPSLQSTGSTPALEKRKQVASPESDIILKRSQNVPLSAENKGKAKVSQSSGATRSQGKPLLPPFREGFPLTNCTSIEEMREVVRNTPIMELATRAPAASDYQLSILLRAQHYYELGRQ